MKNHFINEVEFKNFKCFKDLKVKDLKRVNLISGKNNIGKTAFLEGLMLFLSSNAREVVSNIRNLLKKRQKNILDNIEFDIIYQENTFIELKSDNKMIKIEYIKNMAKNTKNKLNFFEDNSIQFDSSGIEIKIKTNHHLKEDIILSFNDFLRNIRFISNPKNNQINYISSSIIDEKLIAIYYGALIDMNKEKFLNDSLSLFDENIVALKQKMTERGVVLKLQLKNRNHPVLLSSFGDGINRFIAILCAIWASKDGFLFIDEIENGIYYTNYKKLWKFIFEASKMANCQVFATTHSKECIEAFNEVNKTDGVYLEFYRNQKNNLIEVKERNNEELEYALKHNIRIRGE
jgi:AAA15 family ATPase/GTPase